VINRFQIYTKFDKVLQGMIMLEQQNHDALRLGDYLTIAEAAGFLGVSPATLRNWDKVGKLKAVRHPVNGYRLYRQEDLKRLLKTMETIPGGDSE
jgi:MerR family copper efflux transcriptional regulator